MREISFENKWVSDGDVMALHEIMIWRCSICQFIILKPRFFGDRAWVLATVPEWSVIFEN